MPAKKTNQLKRTFEIDTSRQNEMTPHNKMKMKFFIPLLLINILYSCMAPKVTSLDARIMDKENKQILFFSKIPDREFIETGLVEIRSFTGNNVKLLSKLHQICITNKYDAIINIKGSMVTNVFGFQSYYYSGIGINYK